MNAQLPMPSAGPVDVVALPFNSLLNMHPASQPNRLLNASRDGGLFIVIARKSDV